MLVNYSVFGGGRNVGVGADESPTKNLHISVVVGGQFRNDVDATDRPFDAENFKCHLNETASLNAN